jgi:hypothetical protein
VNDARRSLKVQAFCRHVGDYEMHRGHRILSWFAKPTEDRLPRKCGAPDARLVAGAPCHAEIRQPVTDVLDRVPASSENQGWSPIQEEIPETAQLAVHSLGCGVGLIDNLLQIRQVT